jgi:beta-galactosidase
MVHGLNLDWKRFVTDQTIDFYEHECKAIRELTPDIPVTTNFMGDGDDLIPFQSLDYGKFAEHVDIISWDCYPAWHNDWGTTADLASKVGFINDQYRALKNQPFLIMESTPSLVNWHPVNKAKRPGMHLLSSMQFLAHDADSVMYFQWRKSRGSSEKFHGAVVDHDGSSENRVFQDVAQVGRALEQVQAIKGTGKKARVAILYDWDNNWALDDAQGFAQATKRYPQTLQEHYRYFWNRDIPVDVITSDHDFDKYDLIVAPMLYLIRETTIEKLSSFVSNGGHLVTTYITGYVNETDLTYLGGWPQGLQDLFGIKLTETDTLYPSDRNELIASDMSFEVTDYCSLIEVGTATTLATYGQDFYAGQAAVTYHPFGNGQAYFIGARTGQDYLAKFYGEIFSELELGNSFVTQGHPDVSVQGRDGEEASHYFVMNFSEEVQHIRVARVSYDLLSEQSVGRDIELAPYGVMVLV